MEATEGGIKPVGVEESDHLGVQNGGRETDAGVHWVQRGASRATIEGKGRGEKGGPGGKVAGSSGPFVPTDFIHGLAHPQGSEGRVEPAEGLFNFGA